MPRKPADSATTTAPPAAPKEQAPRPSAARLPGESPVIARKVWIHVESTAKLGGLAVVGLHEVPLMRKKLAVDGEVRLIGEWPEATPRRRDMRAADLSQEYNRLREVYTYEDPNAAPGANQLIDVVADLYGPPAQSRLVAVLRRIDAGFAELEAKLGDEIPTPAQLEDIVALTSHEADFSDGIDYEPAAGR